MSWVNVICWVCDGVSFSLFELIWVFRFCGICLV